MDEQLMLEDEESIQAKKDNIKTPFKFSIILWILQIINWIGIASYILFYTLPIDIILKKGYKNKDRENFSDLTTLAIVFISLFFFGMISYAAYIMYEIKSFNYFDYDEFMSYETIIDEIKYLLLSEPIFQIRLYNLNNYEGTSTGIDHIDKRFKFISCRDISGKLTLNSHCCIPKSYAILNVNYDIGFADNETLSDYEKEKEKFINENKNKFSYQLYEFKYLNIIKPNQKVIINKAARCYINNTVFFIFVLFTLGEMYKIIIYFIGCSANFTIKKVVSSRNDLSGACYNEAYDKFNPQLQIFGKEIKFEESLFIQNYQSNTKLTPE